MIALWTAPFRGLRAGPALAVLAAVWFLAIATPWLGYPIGADVDPTAASEGPSAAHWLGTDHLGRDVASRTALATRAFVGPGLAAALLAVGLGVPLGAAAGWDRSPALGPARLVIDGAASLPAVVLVLLLAAVRGGGSSTWALGAGLASAPGVASLVAERLERLAVESHVEAARAHGFAEAWVLIVHGLWVGSGRAVARRTLELLGTFAALECTLSYLGPLGTPEPSPSWGNMIAFEWGASSWATWAPALALWTVAWVTSRAGRTLAEEVR